MWLLGILEAFLDKIIIKKKKMYLRVSNIATFRKENNEIELLSLRYYLYTWDFGKMFKVLGIKFSYKI